MSRLVRLGAGLLALILLLGGYFYLKGRPAADDGKRPEVTRIPLVEQKSDDLVAVVTDPADGPGYRLTREGEMWSMDVPWKDELDTRRLGRIASDATALTADRELDAEEADLEAFGLAPPQALVDLQFADGSKLRLDVGAKTPSGTKRYLKLDGDERIFTVSSFYLDSFFADPVEFRIAAVPSVNPQSLTHLKIVKQNETIELVPFETVEKAPPGSILSSLAMVSPIGPRGVDTTALENLLKSLPPAFRIAEFVDDAPDSLTPWGLDRPAYRIELADAQQSLSFAVGDRNADGNYYVSFAGDPRVLAIPADDLAGLLAADSFTLTEKFVLIINIDDVDSFEVESDGEIYRARIERSGEGDDLVESYYFDGREIEEGDFKGFYQDLIGILADAPNRGESDRGDAALTVRYRLNKGPVDEVEASFVPVDRDFYAAYRDGKSLFLVSSLQIDKVFETISRLRE